MKQIITTAFTILSMSSAFAAEAPDPSVKMREQLRNTMLQLRTAQSDAANAQAAQVAAEQKAQELTAEIAKLKKSQEALVKQSNESKVSLEESIAVLSNKNKLQEKKIVALDESLAKWKTGYQKAAEIARQKEAERAKAADEVISVKRTIADRERKNIGLYNTSLEILERYEGYAFGKSLAAREPFIGNTRVKVENMVQGYKDKIIDNRISSQKP